jgi:hypothetical protein
MKAIKKCKLKWETGPVPVAGEYRVDPPLRGEKYAFIRPGSIEESLLRRWSGPIPEPEAEGV